MFELNTGPMQWVSRRQPQIYKYQDTHTSSFLCGYCGVQNSSVRAELQIMIIFNYILISANIPLYSYSAFLPLFIVISVSNKYPQCICLISCRRMSDYICVLKICIGILNVKRVVVDLESAMMLLVKSVFHDVERRGMPFILSSLFQDMCKKQSAYNNDEGTYKYLNLCLIPVVWHRTEIKWLHPICRSCGPDSSTTRLAQVGWMPVEPCSENPLLAFNTFSTHHCIFTELS